MQGISTYSLNAVNGNLSSNHLQHLLRRCLFGIGHKEIAAFDGKNIHECLAILLKPSATPPVPVQYDSDVIDPIVPNGKVWVNAPYETDLIDNRRGLLLKMWWTGQLINRDNSLTAKMTLFWHNHFVTEMDVVKDSRYSYRYMALLHRHALGNFKALISEGIINIAMLVYLNGNTNNKAAPNENFGRELLELFTLGKTKDVHYTEEDVKAAARTLSGWKDNKDSIESDFFPDLHDSGDKKFSSYFEGEVIKGKAGVDGKKEKDALVEMIFKRRETAKFVCRNIYRGFVNAAIDEQVEQHIIEPLAQIFMEHGFEIVPVLRALLSSEHFFDAAFKGCIVKSPVDFLLGSVRQFDLVSSSHLNTNREPWLQFYFSMGDLGMDIGNPPSVAGWPAYYQEPKFHQWWINSASLGLRAKMLHKMSTAEGMEYNGTKLSFDYVQFVHAFKKPEDAGQLVEDCTRLLLAVEITAATKLQLKQALLSGQQTDYYWSEAWTKFLAKPDDDAARSVVETRLRALFTRIFSMPEYQMM